MLSTNQFLKNKRIVVAEIKETALPISYTRHFLSRLVKQGVHAPFAVGAGELLQQADPEQPAVAVLRRLCRKVPTEFDTNASQADFRMHFS